MRIIIAAIAVLFAAYAGAQTCDVTYTMDVETKDGQDVSMAKSVVFGAPFADVEDNSKRSMRVVNLASKLQDRGGPYTVELGEWRACDGKPAEKFAASSIEVRGVTIGGMNRLARLSLQVAGEITERYENRDLRGAKQGWDHAKARKVKRDDQHRKQW